jgi:hypothetical protein
LKEKHQPPRADCLRRLLAALCAALVFALGLFSASPLLHQQLHHGADSAPDDSCAIVLFANGVSVPLALTAPPPPSADWQEFYPAVTTEIFLDSPRYLLQPERGPPAC